MRLRAEHSSSFTSLSSSFSIALIFLFLLASFKLSHVCPLFGSEVYMYRMSSPSFSLWLSAHTYIYIYYIYIYIYMMERDRRERMRERATRERERERNRYQYPLSFTLHSFIFLSGFLILTPNHPISLSVKILKAAQASGIEESGGTYMYSCVHVSQIECGNMEQSLTFAQNL